MTHLGVTGEDILAAFLPYRPDGITAALSEANLRAKLENGSFRSDLNVLVATSPSGYDTDEAAELVIAEVLSRL